MSVDATGVHRLDDVVDLGKFLQARRARVNPAEVGLPEDPHRRAPGLRREELALLAGVSVDYYTRLEQGRAKRPSEQVLDAVARALRLDETTRAHLHRLAGSRRSGPTADDAEVRPSLRTMLAAIDAFPALIVNHRQDVLASNRLARLLYGGFGWDLETGPNIVRLLFDDDSRAYFPDWEACANESVAQLRKLAALFPEDGELTTLIGELVVRHRYFAELWARAEVRVRASGAARFDHPMVGLLELDKDEFRVADGSGQMLVTLTAAPGTDGYEKLTLLGGV